MCKALSQSLAVAPLQLLRAQSPKPWAILSEGTPVWTLWLADSCLAWAGKGASPCGGPLS